jgi:type VI secretion system ImpC/EvpB family protein
MAEQADTQGGWSTGDARSLESVAVRAAVPRPAAEPLPSLLERCLAGAAETTRGSPAAGLLECTNLAAALRAWAAVRIAPGERLTREQLIVRLGADIAALDASLARQVDAILHAPALQRLEASWRGLAWLVQQALEASDDAEGRCRIEIRVLSVTKRELARDRGDAVEFDRSQLWRKVYEEEFGTAGGTPYGLLVTDHAFGNHPDDVDLLGGLSEVAMAAFSPLVAAPQPGLLGMDAFTTLENLPPLASAQRGPGFVKWQALRDRDESRFVGLPLPRVLARRPYDGWVGRPEAEAAFEATWSQRGFRYRESVDRADGSGRLWMSAVWPLAGVIVREYGRSGWFAEMRGGSRGAIGGGLVEDMPGDRFDGLDSGSVIRGPTEVYVTEPMEEELAGAGLVPLCNTGPDGRAVFHSVGTLHRPAVYDSAIATANARVSSQLQYVLCVSRFAHYLKVIMRDKLGSFTEAAELERFLGEWVNQYVTPDDQASAETRAKMPLRAARVEVRDEPGTAGAYRVVMRLQPHFQLDRLDATLRLVSTVRRQGRG